ncbi:ATP-binding protein [Roseimarinus sediminis]|uniref:ATP-binding protein n=1 Tax=Roseimarinus sediminis TaxID=1610899 RepID=UPI003D24D2C2
MNIRNLPRSMERSVLEALKPGHVVGLLGARRVGKTFLMEQVKTYLSDRKILTVQGDNLDVAEILSSSRLSLLERFVKGYDTLFIDEAQMIPDIGANLKLLVDVHPEIVVFVTGSSAFDLKTKTGEPLTGRSTFFNLYPFAQMELSEDFLKVKGTLEQKLIFGMYPQVYLSNNVDEKIDYLESIREGYLLKDLLLIDNMKSALFVLNLLRLIAFQIGNEVSFSELGRALNADNKTVQRYLELLEKMYVIFSLNGFSRNLRKEYTKSPRYYFWDNGIRNALISNYNQFAQRDDVGKLWENYCISERMKRNHYSRNRVNSYFWRTYDQKEIDYVEESGGKLFGYEMKWGKSRSSGEKLFSATYANATVATINPENHLDFIL